MRLNSTKFLICALTLVFSINLAQAQVATPQIQSARFDSQGRLVVRTSFDAIAGCYVAVNGGLNRKEVETGIISKQLTTSQAEAGSIMIRTQRKYFCKKRTLYINVELVCLNDMVGSATSLVRGVSVPDSNISSR